MRSKIRWFTEFCNSHYVSHFAAFFIVARTKISVAKSCECQPWMELGFGFGFGDDEAPAERRPNEIGIQAGVQLCTACPIREISYPRVCLS